MEDKLKSLAEAESEKLNISPEKFLELAEIGCNIAFKDDLKDRINILGGLEYLSTEWGVAFLLTCANLGALKEQGENLI